MAKGSTNAHLNRAKPVADDEFYTRIADIEAEVAAYPADAFRGAAIHCNCDDHRISKFVGYFLANFERLGLSRLTATHYSPAQIDMLSGAQPPPQMLDWDGRGDPAITELRGDGSYDSPECLEITRRSDLVISNPPFSRFNHYISTLSGCGAGMLVIGPMHSVAYTQVWGRLMSGEIRLGAHPISRFDRPDGTTGDVACLWFTTLRHGRKPAGVEPIPYDPDIHPAYDNYDALEAPGCGRIPDTDRVVGVPINYITRHDPDQFEILGLTRDAGVDEIRRIGRHAGHIIFLNGTPLFHRIFIRRRR